MISSRIVQNENDFVKVLPLVLRYFSKINDIPLSQSLKEICEWNEDKIVILVEKDKVPEGYLCGWFTGPKTFFISQTFASSPKVGNEIEKAVVKMAKRVGINRIATTTPHPPKVFEKRGFKLKRFLMEKEI